MDLGELWGSLNLDDTPFGEAIKGALGKLTDFQGKGVKLAAGAGVAVALAFGASVVANMNIEAGNDKLAAQLGLTEDQSAKAGRVAGDAYAANYGESMEQVQGAVGAVIGSIKGMREASDAELQAATENALNFASVFEVDVNRAAQVAGQAITTGLAKDATEAFDLLTAAAQKVPPALREDLLDAVDEYGPMFSQLGISGEQAFALLVDSSEKGMYGIDKAGDAVKEFTIRSTDMSKASQDAYKTIGLDAQQMATDILAGGDKADAATQKIVDGLLGIKDPATQANTAIALFGTPLEDLGTDQIPKFLTALGGGSDAMEGFEGSAARMDQTLNDNAANTLAKWKRGAEAAFLGLGNWAIPHIDAVAKSIDDWLGPLGGSERAVQVLAAVIGVVLIPALLAWGIQATIAGAKNAAAWLSAQWASIKSVAVQAAGTAYIIGQWILMGAQALLQAGRMALAWTIGVVTGAATSVISMGIAVASVIGGWLIMAAQALIGAAAMAAAWLIAIWPIALVVAAVVAVVILIAKNWDWIKAKTKAAWDWIVNLVKAAPGKMLSFFLNWTLLGLIIKHWDQISGAFSAGVSKSVAFVKGLPGKAKSALGNLGSLLLGAGEDIMRGLLNGIENGFAWVRDKLSGVGKLIPGWLKKVLGIHSPSTVMADEVGQWVPAGVAEGIDNGVNRFLNPALSRMMAAATADITGTTNVGVIGTLTGAPSLSDGLYAGIDAATAGKGMTRDDLDYLIDGITTAVLGGSSRVASAQAKERELSAQIKDRYAKFGSDD